MRRAPAPVPQDHMPLTSLAGPAHAATHGGAFPAACYRSRWEYSCLRADGWWLVTVVALANAIWGARAPRSARSGGRSRPGMATGPDQRQNAGGMAVTRGLHGQRERRMTCPDACQVPSGPTIVGFVLDQGQLMARSRSYQVPALPPTSAGPTGTNPALLSTFWDATFSWVVAALSMRSPYCSAARWHSSRTVAVATPRPATRCATR